MPTYKVLLTDYAWNDLDIEREVLAEVDAELIAAPDGDAATLIPLAADADAIMTTWAEVPAAVIDAAPCCRIVARLGIGLDNIDVEACTRRRIPVTNVPDYCLTEVAEHALALLFSLARKTAFYHLQTKSGDYDLQAGPPLLRIEGQTLGIVGLGQIGRKLAEKAGALGLRVVAAAREGQNEAENEIPRVPLPQLLAESDYVSLHLPLTPQTRHIIGQEQLAAMKPTAYLINTARGGLVDHAALAAALEAGQLAGAALDVQQPEPPDLSQTPYNDPQVIVTPHAAFLSRQSLAELRRRASQCVAIRLRGEVPPHVVNPQVLV